MVLSREMLQDLFRWCFALAGGLDVELASAPKVTSVEESKSKFSAES